MNIKNRIEKIETSVQSNTPATEEKKGLDIVLIEPDETRERAITRWEAGSGEKLDCTPQRGGLPGVIFVQLVESRKGSEIKLNEGTKK